MFNSKVCPKCAERIKARAIKCKFCKSMLVPMLTESQERRLESTPSVTTPPITQALTMTPEEIANPSRAPGISWCVFISIGALLLAILSGVNQELARFASASVFVAGLCCVGLLAITLTAARAFRKLFTYTLLALIFSQAWILVNIGKTDEISNPDSVDWAARKIPGAYPQNFEIFRSRFNRALDSDDGQLIGAPHRIKNGLQIRNADNFCVQMTFFPSGNPRAIMCGGPMENDSTVFNHFAYLVTAIKASDSTLSTLEASKILERIVSKKGEMGVADHGSIRFIFSIIANTYFLTIVDMSSTKEVED